MEVRDATILWSTVAWCSVISNEQAPWDEFDASDYLSHNFLSLRSDDRAIVLGLKRFMQEQSPELASMRVLDIGPGTNLYPALVLAPWAASIDFIEPAPLNRRYLERQVGNLDENWDEFWELLAGDQPWSGVDPQRVIGACSSVADGSIFSLPTGAWDAGLMFFVAESISDLETEFEAALEGFLLALRPGGLVMAAFMEGSTGYDVGGIRFPAFAIEAGQVEAVARRHLSTLSIERIPADTDPLRDGYTGMLWMTGVRTT